MLVKLAIISVLIVLLNSSFYKGGMFKTCETEVDSLTKRVVYKTVNVLPENVGGQYALVKKLVRMPEDSIPDIYNLTYTVAFIVNTDSTISGKRIINRVMDNTALHIFDIMSSLKWIPAKCGDKNVPMIYTQTINIEISDQW